VRRRIATSVSRLLDRLPSNQPTAGDCLLLLQVLVEAPCLLYLVMGAARHSFQRLSSSTGLSSTSRLHSMLMYAMHNSAICRRATVSR
jgi:hypothetical protein